MFVQSSSFAVLYRSMQLGSTPRVVRLVASRDRERTHTHIQISIHQATMRPSRTASLSIRPRRSALRPRAACRAQGRRVHARIDGCLSKSTTVATSSCSGKQPVALARGQRAASPCLGKPWIRSSLSRERSCRGSVRRKPAAVRTNVFGLRERAVPFTRHVIGQHRGAQTQRRAGWCTPPRAGERCSARGFVRNSFSQSSSQGGGRVGTLTRSAEVVTGRSLRG